ncbi:uncharacterized protein LOC117605749 isoform X2 [Osmia lignaria lignaria]|uniref:uncharacterized protein LOC117605749 isoform X2 n=1 Tax=Osmia lignaria lignaria TaxID=1437193 RepID=UPI00402BCEA1
MAGFRLVERELELTKRTDVTLKRENETLKETMEDSRRQISNLTGGNSVLQSQVATLVESKLELEKTVIRLRKEVIDTRDACLETERRTEMLLNESRKENDSMRDEHRKEIERLQQEIASLRTTTAIKTKNEKMKNNSCSNNSEGLRADTILMPEDNPVADMTRQLISNREKIEVLSRQNERLSKTLHRLREYRLMGQITTNGSNK